MNKYPGWLNALVVIIFLMGLLLALPNIYGSVPAIQMSGMDGAQLSEARLAQIVRTIENAGITPEAAYLKDGRTAISMSSGLALRPVTSTWRSARLALSVATISSMGR